MKQVTYTYHIDLDERGLFRAHVENTRGKTVFSLDYPQYGCLTCGNDADNCTCESMQENLQEYSTIFDDGFMANSQDMQGLCDYLVSLGIMRGGYELEFVK